MDVDLNKLTLFQLKRIRGCITCDSVPYVYEEQFYTKKESKNIFNYLDTLNYKPTSLYLFGRVVFSKRKMLWFVDREELKTDKDLTYCFSRNHIMGLPPEIFTDELKRIKHKVEEYTKQKFNALLINRYEPGDKVDWHNDDDPWLGEEFIVPSISFGTERTFKLRSNNKSKEINIKLKDGSMIIMLDKCQKNWKHTVPPSKKTKGVRYNLTFRNIIPEFIERQPKCKKINLQILRQLYNKDKLMAVEAIKRSGIENLNFKEEDTY